MIRKQWIATAIIATLLVGNASLALAAEPTANEQQPAHHHGEHHKRKPLTPEQKAALQKAGVDMQKLNDTEKQIHDTLQDIRTNGHQLKELIETAKNRDTLHEQVMKDLSAFHDDMHRLKEMRHDKRELRKEFRAAVEAQDVAKIKAVYAKVQASQQQELKLVQAAQQAMKAEVQKIQSQAKK